MIRNFLFIAFLLFTFIQGAQAQFYFLEDAQSQIEVEFLKKKVETEANETFFNVLKIKNPSERTLTFQANFSYPSDWSFMGDKNQRLTLAPNDSLLLPFRAATSLTAKGDIGYAIVASLTDLKGNTFKNEYSFVNVPKIQNLKFIPLNRIEYISPLEDNTEVKLLIANNGNTDEEVYVDLQFNSDLEIKGSVNNVYHQEHILKPYTDTIIQIPVTLANSYYSTRQYHRIKATVSTADTAFNTSLWLKKLDWRYKNDIPSNYKFAQLEVSAIDIFSKNDPTYLFWLTGNYLTKNHGEFSYRFQSLNNSFYDDPWKNSRIYLSYRNRYMELELGDVTGNYEQNTFGRGIHTTFNFSRNTITALYTQSLFKDRSTYGGSYTHNFKKFRLGGGYSFADDTDNEINSHLGFLNLGIRSKELGNLNTRFGLSVSEVGFESPSIERGLGGELNYSGSFSKLRVDSRTKYGDEAYSGTFNGRLNSVTNLRYSLSTKNILLADYSLFYVAPARYVDGVKEEPYKSNTNISRLFLNHIVSPKTLVSTGLMSEGRYANNFVNQSFPHDYKTRNALLYFSSRFKLNDMGTQQLNLNVRTGGNFVVQHDTAFNNDGNFRKAWFSAVLAANYFGRFWGLYLNYYHGPNSISQQYTYSTSKSFAKNIRVMPYISLPLVQNMLYLDSRLTYTYDVTATSGRTNITTDLKATLGDSWEFLLSNTIGNTTTKDYETLEKFSYTTSFFEFRIRKDFVGKQPRYQYYDLDMVFFKDLNGNRIKDPDEPGISNVFLAITKDDERQFASDEYNTTGHFMPTELLTDMTGRIQYKNIPNGFYNVEYKTVGKMTGAYSAEESMQQIYMNEDKTIYVPFFENNKIFGQAVMNRSKLSNLGDIDLANIKVTAEDSYGRTYSTLTDANGYFTIYVPSVDRYKVKINNIFFENFDLEQNNYEVQLNGYKQFEVNFVFNEKKRRINFTSSYEYGSSIEKEGVEIVRRTNLNGTVKDATNLKPIVATIRVVDDKGEVITEAKSNLKTGIFMCSFIAGDNFSVEVLADDYWYYAEKLYDNQLVTFKNLRKNVLLKGITVGQLIPMRTLLFESGSTEIAPTAFPELERLLKMLKKNPTVKIAVHGHADDLEILDSEVDLALERAKLVAKYLIANGYNRVKYVGHSNTKPVAENETEDGRRQNRRVEIVVTGK